MVQGYYSLDKAAEILGMTVDELSRMAREREIRAFADAGSWKFRQQDIEELRRTRQFGSDPEIRLSDPGDGGGSIMDEDDDHVLKTDRPNPNALDSAPTVIGMRGTAPEGESDVKLELGGDSSDSDVKLVDDSESGSAPEIALDDLVPVDEDIVGAPSDSDIRMTFEDSALAPKKKISADLADRTEEITLAPDPRSDDGSEVPLRPAAKGPPEKGPAAKAPAADADADFRIDDDLDAGFRIEGESGIKLADFDDSKMDVPAKKGSEKKTDKKSGKKPAPPAAADSGSDSDMSLGLDDIRLEDDSDFLLADESKIGTVAGSDSGINLSKPDDSGISLEADEGASDSEFEVSLDTDDSDIFGSDDVPAFKDDSAPKALSKAKKSLEEDSSTEDTTPSDSDFELSVDEDFEVEEESGSEVVALDDEEEEDEEEEDYSEYAEAEEAGRPKVAVEPKGRVVFATPAPAPWPTWMAVALSFSAVLLGLCGIMMYEVMRHAWSYQAPYSMSATLIKQVNELGKMVGL